MESFLEVKNRVFAKNFLEIEKKEPRKREFEGSILSLPAVLASNDENVNSVPPPTLLEACEHSRKLTKKLVQIKNHFSSLLSFSHDPQWQNQNKNAIEKISNALERSVAVHSFFLGRPAAAACCESVLPRVLPAAKKIVQSHIGEAMVTAAKICEITNIKDVEKCLQFVIVSLQAVQLNL